MLHQTAIFSELCCIFKEPETAMFYWQPLTIPISREILSTNLVNNIFGLHLFKFTTFSILNLPINLSCRFVFVFDCLFFSFLFSFCFFKWDPCCSSAVIGGWGNELSYQIILLLDLVRCERDSGWWGWHTASFIRASDCNRANEKVIQCWLTIAFECIRLRWKGRSGGGDDGHDGGCVNASCPAIAGGSGNAWALYILESHSHIVQALSQSHRTHKRLE